MAGSDLHLVLDRAGPAGGANRTRVRRQSRTHGGLFWIHDGVVGRITDAGLDRDVVYSIAGAGSDVWVGRQHGGVTRLRQAGAGWSAVRITEAEGLPRNSVYAVALARDGAG